MKTIAVISLSIFAYTLTLSADLTAQIPGFKNIQWTRNKIRAGLILKSSHTKLDSLKIVGRTESAAGMTLGELSDLMVSLKCRDVVNLDGGGSTTMWIRNEAYGGIVNMPCDNKKFDHEGARAVSDIIIVR